ncbi:hypothetical protein SAMN05443247_04655 [Bradyrhizobium erythrophlei]|nr:hypothetical protein SAMN05443247_04655 [Bradyrhizobium erythrophlei]
MEYDDQHDRDSTKTIDIGTIIEVHVQVSGF